MPDMPVPSNPRIYHIVHLDHLASIVTDGHLWCDSEIIQRTPSGTTIGMTDIKRRRLTLPINSHPGLHVGDCVPFYFCPRSVMLFMLYKGNHPDLNYHGGQEEILHLEADLYRTVEWAEINGKRWAFTLSNAGSNYFEDRNDLKNLGEIDWPAIQAHDWRQCKEGKQAEFLLEHHFPWPLIDRIGVSSESIYRKAVHSLPREGHRPSIEVRSDWYY